MNILVAGSGGREHALGWKLSQSPKVTSLHFAPGNPGTSQLGTNHNISQANTICELALQKKFDLVIVVAESLIEQGLANLLRAKGILTFGPEKEAYRLERSFAFTKQFMSQHQIPTANYRIFRNQEDAKDYLKRDMLPLVLKLDGPTSESRTFICDDILETRKLLEEIFVQKKYGNAGKQIIIEELLQGSKTSLMTMVSGSTLAHLISSTNYSALLDENTGPNTKGMGSVSPSLELNSRQLLRIEEEILIPTIHGLKMEGIPFNGILYTGLIISKRGPKVISQHISFGDPETQAMLPLMKSDLASHLYAAAEEKLDQEEIEWEEEHCTSVILTSEGYPENTKAGKEVVEFPQELPEKNHIFYEEVRNTQKKLFTNGGRVFSVSACGKTLEESREAAYNITSQIKFEGCHYRKDIGKKPES